MGLNSPQCPTADSGLLGQFFRAQSERNSRRFQDVSARDHAHGIARARPGIQLVNNWPILAACGQYRTQVAKFGHVL